MNGRWLLHQTNSLRHSTAAKHTGREAGYTIVELLVSMFVSSILLMMVLGTLSAATSYYHDRSIKAEADESARVLLDLVAYDLRMTGAGVPFGQADFQIGAAGLGTAPLPLLTNADGDSLTIRFSEQGNSTVITENYTPGASDLDFTVFSTLPFADGDLVYLSNMTQGREQGMRAEITGINGDEITIDPGYVTTAGVTFPSGSTIHRVSEISYDGSSDLTRSDGIDSIILLPGSRLEFAYYSEAGAILAPPLTETEMRNELSRIRVTVRVTTTSRLKDGAAYTAVASQDVTLRNLIFSRL